MGRGKVEVKRIENKINRQVTFAKRRNGLLKKAYELSVLCDADLALVIFSNRDKLYEFCTTTSSMANLIERYRKCVYGAVEANQPAGMQCKYEDYLKLKSKVEDMQRSQRHFLGEDLEELGAEDLNIIEHQLDSSLNRIRSTRAHLMLNQLNELHRKEEVLLETNRELRRKLGEATTSFQPSRRDAQNHDFQNNRSSPQPEAFFEPLPCNNNSVHFGYNNSIGTPEETATTSTGLGFTPYWML